MLASVKKILRLPVFTESGAKLGRIFDFTLDAETHIVKEYLARQLPFGGQEYIINPAQVVKITAEKMIAQDAILKEKAKIEKVAQAPVLENVAN